MRSTLTVGLMATALAVLLVAGAANAQLIVGFESARQLGMGRAYAAVSDDAGGIFSNPAGMVGAKGAGASASAQVNSDIQDSASAAYIAPSGDGLSATAFSFRYFKDKGTVSGYETETEGIGYAFGQSVQTDLSVGGGFHWWKGSQLGLSDSGWSVDAGLLLQLPLPVGVDGLKVGAVVSNINEPTVMAQKLYRVTTVGAALRPVDKLLVAADVYNVFDDPGSETELRVGAEFQLGGNLVARGGYISEGEIVTFGFGYRAGSLGVEYGLATFASENVNLVGVRAAF